MRESRRGEQAGKGLVSSTVALYLQLKRMEESHQEATEKEVERILGLLQTYFREDRKYDTKFKMGQFVLVWCGLASMRS